MSTSICWELTCDGWVFRPGGVKRDVKLRERECERRRLQKNHLSGSLFTSLCGSLGFCFFALNFVNRKTMECFSMQLNKYWESFFYYVLVVPTTLKQVFSRCNFSDNSVQEVSLMHSNLQLLYYYCPLPSSPSRRPNCLRSLKTHPLNTTETGDKHPPPNEPVNLSFQLIYTKESVKLKYWFNIAITF